MAREPLTEGDAVELVARLLLDEIWRGTKRMKKQKMLLLLCMVLAVRPAHSIDKSFPAAFMKLQSLAGAWIGNDEHGRLARTNFKTIIADTTVMETLVPEGMGEMLTLYTVDGDGIALVHYCPTNNQPRMRATPRPGDGKELVFQFSGAGNLPTLSVGHEHKLIMRFTDNDHLTEEWTWRRDGKDSLMIYQFTRQKSSESPGPNQSGTLSC